MIDSALCGRLMPSKTVAAYCLGIIAAIVLAAWMIGGRYATSACARPAILEVEGKIPVLPLKPHLAPELAPKQGRRFSATLVSDERVSLEQGLEQRLGQFEIIDHSGELKVVYRRSKLLRTTVDIYRTAVVDPSICEVVQYTPREISVTGVGQGATHVTFWFEDGSFRPVTYLVLVAPDPEVQERREERYGLLEEHLAELFPESKVELLVMVDKLIVRGQARSAEEAAQILDVIRGQALGGYGGQGQEGGSEAMYRSDRRATLDRMNTATTRPIGLFGPDNLSTCCKFPACSRWHCG